MTNGRKYGRPIEQKTQSGPGDPAYASKMPCLVQHTVSPFRRGGGEFNHEVHGITKFIEAKAPVPTVLK